MENLINEIRKKQDELIVMINVTFDAIVRDIQNFDGKGQNSNFESIYPLSSVIGFRSKKVIAVIISGERIKTPTWKMALQTILQDAIKDNNKLVKMYSLCDKLLGRKRTRLSTSPNDMRSPLKLAENLYIESHYDTESLLRLLLYILDEISYDYSNVQIVIKN